MSGLLAFIRQHRTSYSTLRRSILICPVLQSAPQSHPSNRSQTAPESRPSNGPASALYAPFTNSSAASSHQPSAAQLPSSAAPAHRPHSSSSPPSFHKNRPSRHPASSSPAGLGTRKGDKAPPLSLPWHSLNALFKGSLTERITIQAFRLAGVDPLIDDPSFLPSKILLLSRLRQTSAPKLHPRPSSTRSEDISSVVSSISASLTSQTATPSSIPLSTLSNLAKDHGTLRSIAESTFLRSGTLKLSDIPSLTSPDNLPSLQILALVYASFRYRSLPLSTRTLSTVLQLLGSLDKLSPQPNSTFDEHFVSTLLSQVIRVHIDDVRLAGLAESKEERKRVVDVTDEIRKWARKRGDVQYSELLLHSLAEGFMVGGRTDLAVTILDELGQDGFDGKDPQVYRMLTSLANLSKNYFHQYFPSPSCLPILNDLLSILSRFNHSTLDPRFFIPGQIIPAILVQITASAPFPIPASALSTPSLPTPSGARSKADSKSRRDVLISIERAVGKYVENHPSPLFVLGLRHMRARMLEKAWDWQGMSRLWDEAMKEGLKPYWSWTELWITRIADYQRTISTPRIPPAEILLQALSFSDPAAPKATSMTKRGIDHFLQLYPERLRELEHSTNPLPTIELLEKEREEACEELGKIWKELSKKGTIDPHLRAAFMSAYNWSKDSDRLKECWEEAARLRPSMREINIVLDYAGWNADAALAESAWTIARPLPDLTLNAWDARLECLLRLGRPSFPVLLSTLTEMFDQAGSPPAPVPSEYILHHIIKLAVKLDRANNDIMANPNDHLSAAQGREGMTNERLGELRAHLDGRKPGIWNKVMTAWGKGMRIEKDHRRNFDLGSDHWGSRQSKAAWDVKKQVEGGQEEGIHKRESS